MLGLKIFILFGEGALRLRSISASLLLTRLLLVVGDHAEQVCFTIADLNSKILDNIIDLLYINFEKINFHSHQCKN